MNRLWLTISFFLIAASANATRGGADEGRDSAVISVEGGSVSIPLQNFDPCTNWLLPESDAATSLSYNHKGTTRNKVTVQSNNPKAHFDVTVMAEATTNGVGAGPISLKQPWAHTLISDIEPGQGSAALRYEASAPAGSAAEAEAHVVTYTVLAM